MICTVTVRRLKPDTYEEFREAVRPEYWPPGLKNVLVLRNDQEPDEVCTIGWLDMTHDELERLRDSPELLTAEAERLARVSAFADTIVVNGVFEVVDDLRPPAG